MCVCARAFAIIIVSVVDFSSESESLLVCIIYFHSHASMHLERQTEGTNCPGLDKPMDQEEIPSSKNY